MQMTIKLTAIQANVPVDAGAGTGTSGSRQTGTGGALERSPTGAAGCC